MSNDDNILNDVPDDKPVRLYLPIKKTKERYRLTGVLQKTEAPRFNLLFKPGTLPADDIDTEEPCIITIDLGGPTVSFEAMISSVSSRLLVMMVRKSMSHEQLRDFFRVDATAQVISRSFHPEFFGGKGERWAIKGKTVDISGSGILASFPEKPPADEQIRLEITLPTEPPETIKVLAHPVRTLQTGDNQYDVAYQFDDISVEDRDKIIGCCLVIQRQMLRLKVQVRDYAKS
jgi:hypothetical protein